MISRFLIKSPSIPNPKPANNLPSKGIDERKPADDKLNFKASVRNFGAPV